jgi:hypothetical protein
MRKQLSKRKRFEIFKRDEFTCQYCGGHPPIVVLHVDHIIPVSKNGGNEMENLITSCSDCNLGKSNIELSKITNPIRLNHEDLKEKENQLKAYYKLMEEKTLRIDSEVFRIAAVLNKNYDTKVRRDYYVSIKKFIEKIGFYEVYDAMELATSKINVEKYAFKYFCGICWKIIKTDE